jgi:hypothetical protein
MCEENERIIPVSTYVLRWSDEGPAWLGHDEADLRQD